MVVSRLFSHELNISQLLSAPNTGPPATPTSPSTATAAADSAILARNTGEPPLPSAKPGHATSNQRCRYGDVPALRQAGPRAYFPTTDGYVDPFLLPRR